ncbi:MAG: hypothetical protein WAK11_02045 [Candidatus Cybelea sp.]
MAVLALTATSSVAFASAPSVADLDAAARAVGNRRDVAQSIGRAIFRTQWPAEVNQVSANEMDGHLIVGIRIWGVKFHSPMTRADFVDEVVSLTGDIFAAAPGAEEIDFWAAVPIDVRKDEVVSGDLARPTSRTVFSVTVLRSESAQALRERVMEESDGVFWDALWARDAFKPVA